MNLNLRSRILAFIFLILLGWMLAAFYGFLGRTMEPAWLPIAGLHTLVGLAVWRWGQTLRLPSRAGWQAYAPAGLIALGSFLGPLFTRSLWPLAEPITWEFDARLLAFVIWIPLVEELVFRLGVGGLLRQRLGIFWGAYGSALLFALAHGAAGWGGLSVPIGPLLLGLGCEWVYVKSGRLSAAMAFHAACNASGAIFSAIDARWLDGLQALYLKV